jgi:hypothetical protein
MEGKVEVPKAAVLVSGALTSYLAYKTYTLSQSSTTKDEEKKTDQPIYHMEKMLKTTQGKQNISDKKTAQDEQS